MELCVSCSAPCLGHNQQLWMVQWQIIQASSHHALRATHQSLNLVSAQTAAAMQADQWLQVTGIDTIDLDTTEHCAS